MKIRIFLLLSALLFLFPGCELRPLDEMQQSSSQIPVKIYWDKSGVSPKNATILFYDSKGNLYKEWQSSSGAEYAEGSVVLSPGRYTAVAFNELRDQIDNLHMQGWNKFDTFEALVLRNLQPIYDFSTRQEGEELVRQPGVLSACIKTFTVEDNPDGCMPYNPADSDYYALSDLHPTRKTARVNLKVQVKGLNNARMPAVAALRNIASGYVFSTDRNTLTPVVTQFTAGNRIYSPGSTRDGTVSTTINISGVLGNRYYTEGTPKTSMYLDLAFMLADAGQTIVEYSTDITDLIKITIDENQGITIDIELEIGPLPDIKPVGGNSGFDTELADWDKLVIPL